MPPVYNSVIDRSDVAFMMGNINIIGEHLAHQILHRITIEAVSGGVVERKAWIEDSGYFRVGDLARMSSAERQKMVDDMLSEGHQP